MGQFRQRAWPRCGRSGPARLGVIKPGVVGGLEEAVVADDREVQLAVAAAWKG